MNIEEVVLSGGHIYAVAFLGALAQIDLANIRRYVGTSAGAITAFLIVLGYTPEQLQKIICNLPLENILDLTTGDVLTFLDKFGAISTDKLIRILCVFCKYANIDKDVSFETLYKHRPIDISIIAYCATDKRAVEFSRELTPQMCVLKALEMTVAIPVIFKPVVYNKKLYIDGAMLDNLPWRFVKNSEKAVGITVRSVSHFKKVNVLEYIQSLLQQCCYELDNRIIVNHKHRICLIRVPSYTKSWLLGYHPAEIKEFIRLGENEFIKFMKQHNYREYKTNSV